MLTFSRKALVCLQVLVASAAGCSSSSSETSTSAASSSSTGATAHVYAALVRATLVDANDLAKAKATHDQIASGAEQSARAAGDIAHDALLGTTMLDSVPNEFLAIDRWNDEAAMKAFYADPNVQKGFAPLFAKPPTIEYFVQVPDWVSWGDMDSGDAFDPYFFHLALGTLADSDVEKSKAAHDKVATAGKQPSIDAGNVAHVVYLGTDDSRRFVAVDIWSKGDPIVPFYTSDEFKAAFAPLFSSVTQPVYQSTDWHQW